jgi:hypothetical protein
VMSASILSWSHTALLSPLLSCDPNPVRWLSSPTPRLDSHHARTAETVLAAPARPSPSPTGHQAAVKRRHPASVAGALPGA